LHGGLAPEVLLEFDGGAGALEGFLRLVGHVLGHAFENFLRRSLDEVFGFLEAERGERTDFLNDLDLLVANFGDDDVELRLLFFGGGLPTSGATGDGNSCGGCSGDVEYFFEGGDEL